ncbi:MAG TPA: hypothetical protein VKZ99_05380 [Gammaproteobacteria bacterium]|nr:hypothetical protein [Gammaproteobacteria bacterium]
MKNRIDSNEQRRQNMNWDEAGNNWETFKGKIQARWNQLSDEQVQGIAGRREKLLEELQRMYGLDAEAAEAQVREFEEGGRSVAGASGRGPTERMREYGSGNETGDHPTRH